MRWLSSLLLVSLVGCASVPAPVPIPIEALADCQEPSVDVRTNGGLAKGVTDLRTALRLCNKDKAILREWHEGKEKP